ncbi:hypothetical protein [Paenibacillus kandeliae]|uniref:hypothetical protein n=1 Tax=Paenibacillus kandeliae TaxID=3231269 RepID=UPI00345999FA
MNNADSTWIDIAVQGLRLVAYLSLLVSAMIGLFGSLAILVERKGANWYRIRSVLVYLGLWLTIVQGVISVINIAFYQGWSAALIPFTTYAGRLSNGFALIAFYTTLAYIVPSLLASRRNGASLPPRFLSALLIPTLGLLMLSGLSTRNYEGLLSLLLVYVFTALCLVWLIVLRSLASDSEAKHKARQHRKFNLRSPDIKLSNRNTDAHDQHDEESHTIMR